MPKDKDRTLNPAAQQRRLEKQKAVKKGKAAVAAQRTERLATRNPSRLEAQIASLQSQRDAQGGKLKPREQKQLEDLERDVARIKKARESVGAPAFVKRETDDRGQGRWNGGRGGSSLGKRRRDGTQGTSDESETTDEEVRRIPWPRDTPPPIPRQARRSDLGATEHRENDKTGSEADASKPDTALPARPPAPLRTTYESKAQIRDLQKEATEKFMPSVVKRKIDAVKGRGGLIEEEDLRRLEGEGYVVGGKGGSGAAVEIQDSRKEKETWREQKSETPDEEALQRLRDEEAAFEREIAEASLAEKGGAMEVEETSGQTMQPSVEEASDEDG